MIIRCWHAQCMPIKIDVKYCLNYSLIKIYSCKQRDYPK